LEDEHAMRGIKKDPRYDPEKEDYVLEDQYVTTELSDAADNELYIRYKLARWNPEVTDKDLETARKNLAADIGNLKNFVKDEKRKVDTN